MKTYFLTPKANRDITNIWLDIARDKLSVADKVESAILENCELLASMPHLGRRRPDLTRKNVRVWPAKPYSNYSIVYEPGTDPLRIVRVVYAGRRKVWRRGI